MKNTNQNTNIFKKFINLLKRDPHWRDAMFYLLLLILITAMGLLK